MAQEAEYDLTATDAALQIEEIPDKDTLYMRVHTNHIASGKLNDAMVFKAQPLGEGLSTEWSRYSSAQDTKENARHYQRDPANYAVISLNVGLVREIPSLSVVHVPTRLCYAHAEIKGHTKDRERDTQVEIRLKLLDICQLEIPLQT